MVITQVHNESLYWRSLLFVYATEEIRRRGLKYCVTMLMAEGLCDYTCDVLFLVTEQHFNTDDSQMLSMN